MNWRIVEPKGSSARSVRIAVICEAGFAGLFETKFIRFMIHFLSTFWVKFVKKKQ